MREEWITWTLGDVAEIVSALASARRDRLDRRRGAG